MSITIFVKMWNGSKRKLTPVIGQPSDPLSSFLFKFLQGSQYVNHKSDPPLTQTVMTVKLLTGAHCNDVLIGADAYKDPVQQLGLTDGDVILVTLSGNIAGNTK